MEADNDTAPACTCGGRWPAFVNCRGHIDGDDANGERLLPVAGADFDPLRGRDAADCGGTPDFEPVHERERTGKWAGYDGDCDGAPA